MSSNAKPFITAHLVGRDRPRGNPVQHIIAVPAEALDRPTVIITEDGKVWTWGGMYTHFPNTGFYLEVQPAFFSKRMMAVLSRAIPALERKGVM